jgi:hypothetical protein
VACFLPPLARLFELIEDFADDGALGLLHLLDETTVFDDDFEDMLLGVGDLDMLFFDLSRDRVAGRR